MVLFMKLRMCYGNNCAIITTKEYFSITPSSIISQDEKVISSVTLKKSFATPSISKCISFS